MGTDLARPSSAKVIKTGRGEVDTEEDTEKVQGIRDLINRSTDRVLVIWVEIGAESIGARVILI